MKINIGTGAIDSAYFKVSSAGKATLTGGSVGSWTIGDKLYASAKAYVPFCKADYTKIKNYISNGGTLTDAELTYYDINGDGSVTVKDMLIAKKIEWGLDSYENYSGATQSTVTVEITPSDPLKAIKLKTTTPWGRSLQSYMGVAECYFPVVKGNTVRTVNGACLDSVGLTETLYDESAKDITQSGTYYIVGATNVPTGTTYGYLVVMARDNESSYRRVFWMPYSLNNIYMATCNNGTWTDWEQIC